MSTPVAPSLVHDDKATIDLTRKPTRADFGFADGRNDRSYQRGSGVDAIVTTVVLPTGTLHIPAFGITADGGDFAGAVSLPPQHIVVQRKFDRAAQAQQSLLADAPTLGLSTQDVRDQLSRVTGATIGSSVVDGLVRNWLAAYVEVIGYEDGAVGVNYTFTIDQFHNDAIDAVVHDGVFPIDLTHRPSRAELAFRDGFPTARVQPAWNATLSVRLELPGGVIQRPVRSVDSTATQTVVSLASSSIADAQAFLAADAPALGVDPGSVWDGAGHVKKTLPGLRTAFYDVSVTVDATLGQPGSFAASLSYTFTYH
ncbi:hypothetical protein [Kutzneria sp. 744]|uniref:hypothetical protein n=1 Tax=Kutzneria sp. (strain 744) TaxID=345341 RepID=UPI0003EEC8F7|nr:hypothetical protein [Kutzneria sp. 744]EWM15208.1 peptidase C14 [Kutzneria sp. 744]